MFQPGESGNPGGRVKDKPFRTALMMELKQAGEDMPELRKIARKLIERAMENNADCREIIDRLDGKVPQEQKHSGGGAPIEHNHFIERRVIKADNQDG